ncbi:MAG TPA: tRNA threonylcarbamoyladenosine dehydratase [Bacteroidales bacterium]|nr:tRNA threonylcarbamoyladenosine dehydratase [Bacteroidales bacterium]HPF01723.1 tRNA threonylcarbamoyladenosine dehydratase [Bacteroidales bacterium]HPJ59757.1 tRNA threonylcarbamoyladenosine dehydratase [Bacteroidales bacterium]HPR11797.1 tRNA threonylcarbamoyladenosine dehydratase [Bacteroidales bacterium]HRW84054.1 tRNA threonylcarbamoyladenosine dehydratase [Bacteroidales bacterium]
MEDWLLRTEMLIGSDALAKLRVSRVLVVGLGGVGAYAAEMIGRAGVGSITIVDGDTIHPSNRNRQLLALESTSGKSKAGLMHARLLDINPGVNVTAINEYIRDDRMVEVLDEGFDYVIDAIDTLSPKIFLIYHSLQRKFPVVSSMGSGGKFDTGQVRISDISDTSDCKLARILRKRLHRLGVKEGFKAVWSPEKVDRNKIVPATGEPNKASVVGTISYMPAAFGIACASVVIRDLAGI